MYVALLILATALSMRYKRVLLLTLVVGLSGLLPMQMVTEAYTWWAICIGFELLKIILAFKLKTRLSYPVMFLSSLMLICHLALLVADNQMPHTVIVPILEHLEMTSCILFSPIILHYLKRKITCLWR